MSRTRLIARDCLGEMAKMEAEVNALRRRMGELRNYLNEMETAAANEPHAYAEMKKLEEQYQHGNLTVNVIGAQVWWKEQMVDLAPKPYFFLLLMTKRPGIVFTREQVMEEIWENPEQIDSDRIVDTQAKHLRNAFRKVDPDFDALKTLYGIGYRWDVK